MSVFIGTGSAQSANRPMTGNSDHSIFYVSVTIDYTSFIFNYSTPIAYWIKVRFLQNANPYPSGTAPQYEALYRNPSTGQSSTATQYGQDENKTYVLMKGAPTSGSKDYYIRTYPEYFNNNKVEIRAYPVGNATVSLYFYAWPIVEYPNLSSVTKEVTTLQASQINKAYEYMHASKQSAQVTVGSLIKEAVLSQMANSTNQGAVSAPMPLASEYNKICAYVNSYNKLSTILK